jgi:hypothetical protein
MKLKKLSIAIAILSQIKAFAFIPPLGFVVKDAFEGRKHGYVEVLMHHKVESQPGQFVEMDERALLDRGQIKVYWTSPSFGQAVGASLAGLVYSASDNSFTTRSSLFLKALLFGSADEFKNAMIAEQFARNDQFQQYRPNVTFEGDPQNWDMKQIYLPQPEIFLSRTASGGSIEVVGQDDSTMQKAIFFEKDKHAVARLQWKERGQLNFWDFEQFGKTSDGTIPKKATFVVAGATLVTTYITYRRIDSERQAAEFRQIWSKSKIGPVPVSAENVLKILLSYR